MKYTRKPDGSVELDGDPAELSDYHKRMANGFPRRTSPVRIYSGKKRASWGSAERKAALNLANKGKTPKQIARHLNLHKLSPIKRTAPAVNTELRRMLADPNRR